MIDGNKKKSLDHYKKGDRVEIFSHKIRWDGKEVCVVKKDHGDTIDIKWDGKKYKGLKKHDMEIRCEALLRH